MAIPSTYDNNAFAGYLANEVLRLVADAMHWTYQAGADITAAAAQVITLNGATVDNAPTITVDAIPTAIYIGNQITFTGHGTTYTAAKDYSAGATSIRVFPYVTAVIADNTVGSYTPTPNPVTHQVYQYIIDESLILLGYTSIAQVTGLANIRRLRMISRIEAWRAVVANTVADSNVAQNGESYSRQQVYLQALQQLNIAQQEYDRLYNEVVVETGTPLFVPSSTSYIKAVW